MLTTFIIPTLSRKTLNRAINSLFNQTNQNWEAIIVFDGVKNTLDVHPKLTIIESEKLNSPGLIRNQAFDKVKTPWISFLDDDDIVYSDYVQELTRLDNEQPDLGFILFRMITNRITPALHIKDQILLNEAGISFSVKTNVIRKYNLKFNSKGSEDYHFLKFLENKEKFVIPNAVVYEVCRNNSDKDD